MRAFFLLLLASLPLFSQSGLAPATIRQIETVVSRAMDSQKVPGLTVAVAAGGELRWSKGFGLSDVESNVPAKASTVIRLASISKPITAVAVLQLAEQGKLDLDAPVRKYVPSFPEKRWPITVRQLLGHLGGIRHYNNDAEVDSTRHYTGMLAPLRIFRNDPLVAEPGASFSYTTYGYVLLGAVVESASGDRFMDYLHRNISEPAGMDTIRDDNVFAIIPNRSRGYRLSQDGALLNCNLADTSNKIPGGGMVSTAADLVKFALAVHNGVLLKPETVERMFTRQTLKSGERTDYGLGWRIGHGWVGHSGGQQGTATMLMMVPERGTATVVMSNLEETKVDQLAGDIMRVLLNEEP